MSNEANPLAVTQLVTQLLDEIAVPYFVVGSLASSLYGVSRSTMDVDIVADLKVENVSIFVEGLKDDFYVDDDMIRAALANNISFNLLHTDSMFKVDIFTPKPRAFDQSQFERRVLQKINKTDEKKIFFASAEDTILAKLEWYRLGGEVSDLQWRDILGVLKTQKEHLDNEFLVEWAEQIGVSDLLKKAREASK